MIQLGAEKRAIRYRLCLDLPRLWGLYDFLRSHTDGEFEVALSDLIAKSSGCSVFSVSEFTKLVDMVLWSPHLHRSVNKCEDGDSFDVSEDMTIWEILDTIISGWSRIRALRDIVSNGLKMI